MQKIKWKYFLDKKGNKNDKAIINGSHFSRQMEDTYFELQIMEGGDLNIKIEDDMSFFYKKKLDLIYNGIFEIILKSGGEYLFHNEQSIQDCKIVKKVYSVIENENW